MEIIRNNVAFGCSCKNCAECLLNIEYHVFCVDGEDLVEMGSCKDWNSSACTAADQETFILNYFETVDCSFE